MISKTHKESFNKNWLFEAPLYIRRGKNNSYNELMSSITRNFNNGHKVVYVSQELNKLETPASIFYWIDNEIAAELEQKPTGLYIDLVAKRPGSVVNPSDFYKMILADAKQLIFNSDKLSDEDATSIWQRLLNDGHKLFVYNTEDVFDKINVDSKEDLEKYLGVGVEFQKYRYVLSESVKEHSTVTTSFDLLETYYHTFNLKGFK
jgi:hypothetical protein